MIIHNLLPGGQCLGRVSKIDGPFLPTGHFTSSIVLEIDSNLCKVGSRKRSCRQAGLGHELQWTHSNGQSLDTCDRVQWASVTGHIPDIRNLILDNVSMDTIVKPKPSVKVRNYTFVEVRQFLTPADEGWVGWSHKRLSWYEDFLKYFYLQISFKSIHQPSSFLYWVNTHAFPSSLIPNKCPWADPRWWEN